MQKTLNFVQNFLRRKDGGIAEVIPSTWGLAYSTLPDASWREYLISPSLRISNIALLCLISHIILYTLVCIWQSDISCFYSRWLKEGSVIQYRIRDLVHYIFGRYVHVCSVGASHQWLVLVDELNAIMPITTSYTYCKYSLALRVLFMLLNSIQICAYNPRGNPKIFVKTCGSRLLILGADRLEYRQGKLCGKSVLEQFKFVRS